MDRTTFFLGESILAHFGVANTGTQPFNISSGGDYRGAARAMRFIVTAQDASGKPMSDPYPFTSNFGGLGGSQTLRPGDKWFQTLSLNRYCRFEAPGKYQIRAQHDLGWQATAERPLPVAGAQIELLMPSPQQARAIVEAIETMPNNQGVLMGQKNPHPQRDFSTLSYVVYLPLLLERIDAGKLDYLQSLKRIETPEVTRALIDRLQGDTKTTAAIAETLFERLPPTPEPDALLTIPRVSEVFKQRQETAQRTWREEFSAPTWDYARRALQSDDRETLRTAAAILERVGTAQDLPVLIEALDRRLEMTAQTPRWQAVGENYVDTGWQLQDDCRALMRSGGAIVSRGAQVPADRTSAGAIALRVAPGAFPKPREWAPSDAELLRHPLPFIRQLTLESLAPPSYPPPAPQVALTPQLRALLPTLLRDPDTSVRAAACDLAGKSRDKSLLPEVLKVVETARNSWLVGYANNAARMLGGQYQVWTIWARRLDEKGLMRLAIPELSKVVAGGSGFGWNSNVEADEGPQLKPRWQKFLVANRVRLEKGQLFSTSEAGWPRDLFPKAFSLSR